jgi:hypothetical protein
MSRTYHHGEWKPWVKRPVGTRFIMMTPSWWTAMTMNKPKRHRDNLMLRGVLMGTINVDATVWELGNHKPHRYFH